MMALNNLTRNVERLDAVRIDGALSQPLCIGNLLCLSIEDLHKITANNLTLLLRVGHAGKITEETLRGIHAYDIQSKHLVVVHHLLEFVLAQHAVVYKDTG